MEGHGQAGEDGIATYRLVEDFKIIVQTQEAGNTLLQVSFRDSIGLLSRENIDCEDGIALFAHIPDPDDDRFTANADDLRKDLLLEPLERRVSTGKGLQLKEKS